MSVCVPEGKTVKFDGARTLFTQPICTPAKTTRVVMLVPVPRLTDLLTAADGAGWTVEHVDDY
ncbi:MAG: hypothetical protein CPDRYMAC_5309 [uncultured Paraburkholderia sp.]|nr:MAG: hypothetical protein CPDRYDRY_5218 [uncultured Paraburkholderia sp.]CAH2940457.1 MAG: hypothetical protein CPDRYMAC_5309 [uncultured Paraburkholderia sp.]